MQLLQRGKTAMKKTINILFFIISFGHLFAQTSNPLDFFPSAIGNYWEYSTSVGSIYHSFVKDSVVENGDRFIFLTESSDPFYKVDTNLCVYYIPFTPALNWKVFDLRADSNDTWMVAPETDDVLRKEAKLNAIYNSFIFGKIRKVKEIDYWEPTVVTQS